MNDETLDKMDLLCVYDGITQYHKINNSKFYVYVIESRDGHYYVGQTKNLESRIKQHLTANKNDILYGKLFILEELSNERQMRFMEILWIVWFKMNSRCINIDCGTYLIRKGRINKNHIRNTNYSKFIEYEVIKGVKILERQTNSSAEDEESFFGRRISD
jgi:hypothetical protein